jgi:outer membrane lipoprotein LolB
MVRTIRAALTATALALLCACHAAPVVRPPAAPWPERKAELQRHARYEVRGRVAVAANGEGINARLRWVQDGERLLLSLQGPLGVGGVQVTSDGESLSFLDSHGERLGDAAAREELRSHLGFEPPLSSLRYWMLGVPDPAQPAQETVDDAQQRLTRLEQGGWQIEYPAYMPVNGQSLPARVTLQNNGVRVRLLVDSWSD